MTPSAVSLVLFVDGADEAWADRAAEIGGAEGHIATELRNVADRLAYVVRFQPNSPAALRARALFDAAVR